MNKLTMKGITQWLCILGLMILSIATQATQSNEVGAAYVVSEEQEQDIQIFLEAKHFSNCKQQATVLQLQYAFGSIELVSYENNDGQCAVLLKREVEHGSEYTHQCDISSFYQQNWVRGIANQIRLLPPVCKGQPLKHFFVVRAAHQQQQINTYLDTIDKAICTSDAVNISYAQQNIVINFDKDSDGVCYSTITEQGSNDIINTCSLTQLQQINWDVDEYGFLREHAPSAEHCQYTPTEKSRPKADVPGDDTVPAKGFLNALLNFLFGWLFNTA